MKEWIKPEIMAEFQKTELKTDEYLGDWGQGWLQSHSQTTGIWRQC